jgi:8-oxo-dGTP diphosphatase
MRTIIGELVPAIQPSDPLERAHVAATLAWINSGAPIYRVAKPALPPQHLVAYFALLDPVTNQLLLVDHKKAGLWLPGGGHVEPGEHPDATVQRELREELHIPARFLLPRPLFLTVTQTVGVTAGHTDVSLWYVLRGDSRQPLQYDHTEFLQIAWFPLDRLPLQRSDPHLERFAAKLCDTLTRGEWSAEPGPQSAR